MPNNKIIDRRLTRKEAAKELEVSPQTLANWASTGRVNIPYHKIGKRIVFYYKSDIDAYIASTRTNHIGS
ncbi:helix-turn-helix transcriptional regulator [Providencia rettgeri]|uniref:helix-turn-helix transcriptional regulator n=1 Tax=Providencia rettgeri TaxID=587 RepID=UPI001657D5B6|nr:helix-turn-helix domain-containing protein [Providencia rettgeri]QNP22250.1 helix-turn-helix domain-containing protein [Providencia rettgeri]